MVQASALGFEVVAGWEQLPAGWTHPDVAGVAVDADDRVYVFGRGEQPVIVYERDGSLVGTWGQGRFGRPHGITVGPDGAVYCADDHGHTVQKFSPDGQLLLMLGTRGQASDSGYDGKNARTIAWGAPPFNRPTNVAVSPNGDIYVSDGYGNARVHRFSASGELLQSWGEPGVGPGQFHVVHGICLHADGRVFVADRENDRIQIFSPRGEFLAQWTDVQRPTQIAFDRDGLVYVAELGRRPGQVSFVHGPAETTQPGRVSVYDPQGNVLVRWSGDDPCAIGNVFAPHGIAVDSRGDLYVSEVTFSVGVRHGLASPECHTIQKFARR